MQNQDWYAPPKAQVGTLASTTCSRDGQFVVVQAGSDLPARCIVCNAPLAAPPKEVKLRWHNPWHYLLVLIGFVAMAIWVSALLGLVMCFIFVPMLLLSVKASPGLCVPHTTNLHNRILAFVVGGVATLVGFVLLIVAGEARYAIVCFLCLIVVVIFGIRASRKVYAKKITKTYARLGGCKEPFLASLK